MKKPKNPKPERGTHDPCLRITPLPGGFRLNGRIRSLYPLWETGWLIAFLILNLTLPPVCFLICGTTPWWLAPVVLLLACALALIPLFLSDMTPLRWELDDRGVTLSYPRFYRRRTRFIPWIDVKDWGFSQLGYSRGEGMLYVFYISPVRLTTVSRTRKRIPARAQACTMILRPEAFTQLTRAGVISFCRVRLGGDGDSDEQYVPMFRSDITESAKPHDM